MLTDAPTVGPCAVAVPAGNDSELSPDRRGVLLAAAIARSTDWDDFVAEMRLREVTIAGTADLDPISRTIAEHFSSLPPHQRPGKDDATAALQRIEIAARILRWLAADSPTPPPTAAARGLSAADPAAYAYRCLAPLYFPKQSCSWRAIVGGILAASLQEVAIRMLDRQSGGELIAYLTQSINREADAVGTIRTHFLVDLPTLCRCLTSGNDWRDAAVCSAASRLAEDPSEATARWEVLWQWVAGESFIAMPAVLKSDAVDWEGVQRRHARICELLRQPDERNRSGYSDPNCALFSAPAIAASNSASGREGHRSSRPFVSGGEAGKASEMLRGEIRMADDPGLSHSMRAVLDRYRAREESLSLLRLCAIGPDGTPSQSDGRRVAGWQDAVMAKLEGWSCGELALAFLTSQGDLGLLVGGLERNELTRKLRTELLSVGVSAATATGASTSYGLVAGAATVANPHRYCEMDQLFAAVDRCVQGALLHGRGAVKSLDVF